MDMEYTNTDKNVVDVVCVLLDLIENKGYTPNEAFKFIDMIKENAYEELVEVYDKINSN